MRFGIPPSSTLPVILSKAKDPRFFFLPPILLSVSM